MFITLFSIWIESENKAQYNEIVVQALSLQVLCICGIQNPSLNIYFNYKNPTIWELAIQLEASCEVFKLKEKM